MTSLQIVEKFRASGLKLAVAESLTGGLLASTIVQVPGASDIFVGGVVAYATELKAELLSVDRGLLERVGPVDPEVAIQMAAAVAGIAAAAIDVDSKVVVGLSTTGVAGPTEQNGHPVGQVFIGLALGDQRLFFEHHFSGERDSIRAQAVAAALRHCLDLLG